MIPNLEQIQAVLDSSDATAWERAFAFGVLRHHVDGHQITEKQVATLEKVALIVVSRFGQKSGQNPKKPGQKNGTGLARAIREPGRLSRPGVPSRFAISCPDLQRGCQQ